MDTAEQQQDIKGHPGHCRTSPVLLKLKK